ncbi:outer membrane beta-barrel protein [Mucilaginibacter sp. AW1-3]
MKFYKSLLFLFILTKFYAADAQTNDSKIIGKVADIQNAPIKDVTVYLLLPADSSTVKFAVSDKDGKFEFDGLQPNKYLISIENIGYEKLISAPYILKRSAIIDVGIIKLKINYKSLNTVDIIADRPFIETKPGKKILNVKNSITSAGSNAFEILKKAPGVKIDNDNNISLDGKNNVLVLIDNKPANIPPEALIEMLQSMPSNTISQIELINTPGARYNAAGGGGAINIKLTRNEDFGINTSVNINSGVQQIGEGHDSKYRGGAGVVFNSRTKDLNVFGNYSYSNIPYNRIFLTDRFVNYKNVITEIDADYFSDQSRLSNNYRLGADYNISPKHIIGFLVKGLTTNFMLSKNTNTNIINQGKVDSTVVTNSSLNSKASQIAFDLNYKGNFDKAGVLSIDLDYFTYTRNPLEIINSEYFNGVSRQRYRTLTIQNSFPSNYKIYTYNIDYTFNLSPTSTLVAIAKTDYVKTHNNLDFGEIVNQVYQPDAKFTNQFDFTETVNAGGIVYNKSFNKKISLEAGLRVEQTISDGESITGKTGVKNNYIDFFPSLKITDMVNKDNVLLLAYGKSIHRPSYTDLNPFIAYQDQYSYYMGNAYLKPYYLNTIELQHTYKNKFTTTLQFSVTNNFAQSIFIQNDSTKILVTKKSNLGNRYVYSIGFNGQFDLTSWWNANVNLTTSYQRLTASAAESYLNRSGADADISVAQFFTVCKTIKAELDGEYEIPTTFGVNEYRAAYHFDAGITKTISRQASLALTVNDIFNSKRNRFTSTYQNLDVTGNDKTEFRVILLSFTYKFGNKTVKAERTRKTGAEPEQNRAGTGNGPQ